MLTCKSPRKVMRAAYRLAQACLPTYSNEFSRHDFTLPQLFACLVLREHQKKSYRGVQALIEDSADWRADIGLSRTRNHNTLWRAFNQLVKPGGQELDDERIKANLVPVVTKRLRDTSEKAP
jgi:hypothetical protein